jgi:hypothetical protein
MGLKMTQEAFVVGIDVSKDMLDVAILPTGEALRLPNTGKGWGKLTRRLVGKPVAVVAFEATGGYERGCSRPCTQRVCRRRGSIRAACATSPRHAAPWPRTIAWTP